jgi:hypothetical protein
VSADSLLFLEEARIEKTERERERERKRRRGEREK